MCRENKSMMRKIKTLYSRTLLLRAMACGLILTALLNLAGFSAQCAALEENIVRLHVIAKLERRSGSKPIKLACAMPCCGKPSSGTAMRKILTLPSQRSARTLKALKRQQILS